MQSRSFVANPASIHRRITDIHEICFCLLILNLILIFFFFFFFLLQSLVARIDQLEVPLCALKESASQLEQIIPEASRPATSYSVSSLRQRWTRLHAVSRAQERALEDTVKEWRNFTEKVGSPERVHVSRWLGIGSQVAVVHESAILMCIRSLQELLSTISQSIASVHSSLVWERMIMIRFPVNR